MRRGWEGREGERARCVAGLRHGGGRVGAGVGAGFRFDELVVAAVRVLEKRAWIHRDRRTVQAAVGEADVKDGRRVVVERVVVDACPADGIAGVQNVALTDDRSHRSVSRLEAIDLQDAHVAAHPVGEPASTHNGTSFHRADEVADEDGDVGAGVKAIGAAHAIVSVAADRRQVHAAEGGRRDVVAGDGDRHDGRLRRGRRVGRQAEAHEVEPEGRDDDHGQDGERGAAGVHGAFRGGVGCVHRWPPLVVCAVAALFGCVELGLPRRIKWLN